MDRRSNIKVTNFEKAHEYKDGNFTSTSEFVGTFKYSSPECYGNHYYDGRSNDVWSVGVIQFFCLIGKKPWVVPDYIDSNFTLAMRGMDGLRGLISKKGRRFLYLESALDLMNKIFRQQKDRVNVCNALKHPYILVEDCELEDDCYVDLDISMQNNQYNPQVELFTK